MPKAKAKTKGSRPTSTTNDDASMASVRTFMPRMSKETALNLYRDLPSDSEPSDYISSSSEESDYDDNDESTAGAGGDAHSQSADEEDEEVTIQGGGDAGPSRKRKRSSRPATVPLDIWKKVDRPVVTVQAHGGDDNDEPDEGPDITSMVFPFLPKNRRTPGINPRLGLGPNSSAIDCFMSLYSVDILDSVVRSINEYAEKKKKMNTPVKSLRSIFKTWTDVTRYDVVKFIACTIAMGMIKLPDIKMYWSMDQLFFNSFFRYV